MNFQDKRLWYVGGAVVLLLLAWMFGLFGGAEPPPRATAGSNPGPGCSGRLTLPAAQVQPMRRDRNAARPPCSCEHRRQGAPADMRRTTAPRRRRWRRPRRGPTCTAGPMPSARSVVASPAASPAR